MPTYICTNIKNMLGLKLATDPRWANIAEGNLEEILSDHAWCEQKAATNAITIVTLNSELDDLVTDMLALAKEELTHFEQVHAIILKRGYTFGRERPDDYVKELYKFMRKGGTRNDQLIERLLFAAMIEARSCERFKVLSENIKDEELATFYRELMISEAGHYTLFLNYARKYTERIDVNQRWKEWLEGEAEIIGRYGNSERVHG
jgi:tRNA-(ms[2]io[6]A)-hydroxylase